MATPINEKRLPHARFQTQEVTFDAAHVDKVISHSLDPEKSHEVRYELLDANSPGKLYRGSKAPGENYLVLRASETGTYRIRLYIEAHSEGTNPLPQSDFTPVVPPWTKLQQHALTVYTDEANVFTQSQTIDHATNPQFDLKRNGVLEHRLQLFGGDTFWDWTGDLIFREPANSPTERLRFLGGAAAIKFPVTQAPSSDANALDDYEEGSWTPIFGGTGGQSGQVYSVQFGRYVKVGRMVHLYGRIIMSTVGTLTGNVQFDGFPFLSDSGSDAFSAVLFPRWGGLATAVVNLSAYVQPSNTNAVMQMATAAAVTTANMAQADFAANTDLMFSITYRAAS